MDNNLQVHEETLTPRELRMKECGLNAELAYKKLVEMHSAQTMTLDKFGGEHFSPDNPTQLRAAEMLLKMRGDIKPDETIGTKIVNVSGITTEAVTNLLSMLKAASDRMVSNKINGRQTGEIIDVETE